MRIEPVAGGVRLRLHVQPGASTTALAGVHGDRFKLRLQSPPVDGRANEALIEWLAGHLDVPRRQVTLVRGHTSRDKTVVIDGVTVEQATAKLGG